MKKTLALVSMCLSLGLVAAGCGGDDEEPSSESGGAAPTTEEQKPAGGGGGGGKAVKVGMEGIEFMPKEVSVAKGGTITWTNNESVPHDVTKTDGPGEDFSSGSGNMQEGDTFEHTFKEAGTVEYVCTVHPNMTGTVTVE